MESIEMSLWAMLTSSASDPAHIFFMMRPLCAFTVCLEMPSRAATCLFNNPLTTRSNTCRFAKSPTTEKTKGTAWQT